MIRPFRDTDIDEVVILWNEYNKVDVYLPDVVHDNNVKFKNVYIDDNGKIIGFTCINMIPELILVHDKSIKPREKYDMLFKLFTLNKHWATGNSFIELYAFLDTDNWIKHVKSVGFKLFEKGIYYLQLR